jgi:N-acetyl-alpha-D-muramate 1-phosphate uridylyltransferase
LSKQLPPLVILAGGLGTRLKALTAEKPKAMVNVLGKPFIAHQMRLLSAHGAKQVILSVKHFADQIENFVGDGSQFGLSVSYSHDGDQLLGTGGAVLKAITNATTDMSEFAVLYGDSYLDIDYLSVYDDFQKSKKLGLMTVFKNENELVPSNVWMENGEIKAYGKENPSPLMLHVDYGLSFFKDLAFTTFKAEFEKNTRAFDLGEVTRYLLSTQQLATTEVYRRFYEVGSVEGIDALEIYLGKH